MENTATTTAVPKLELLPIDTVIVDPNRFRRDFSEVELLAESIKKIGLLHPIVVDEVNNLIAGERRWRAHKLLGLPDIKATRICELSTKQKALIEIEENIRRKALTWQEECVAIYKMHQMYVEDRGTAKRGSKGVTDIQVGWRVQDTADLLGRSWSKVKQDMELGESLLQEGKLKPATECLVVALEESPQPAPALVVAPVEQALSQVRAKSKPLAGLPTKDAAFKVMKGQKDLAQRMVLADVAKVIATATAAASVQCSPEDSQPTIEAALASAPNFGLKNEDCLVGLAKVADGEVDLIVTDPPWGIEFDDHDMRQGAHGEVSVDSYADVDFLDPIVKECFRVLNDNAHLYMFFAFKWYARLYEMLSDHGFKVDRVPLIWWKHNAFNQNPYIRYTHDYEPILFAWKGGRRLSEVAGSILDVSPVPPSLKIHPTEKPEALLTTLITRSTIEGELVLDPFAGSAATLRAAKRAGRRYLGYELCEKHYDKAADILRG